MDQRDAELVFGLAGRNLGVRFCIDIGVDTQAGRGTFTAFCRKLCQLAAFFAGLDVELPDTLVEAELQFRPRLADAGKYDHFGGHAGC